ncbi:MAG: fimbrillin family protein, partial [Muribaculum sp.]|nr:fimbrillin family protein [Muribaculum sp.]
MKKLFFYVVAAAIALTSCSSEDVVEVNNNGNAIDFRVAMGPGANSRGLETTETNLKEFFVTAVYDVSHGNYFADVLFSVGDKKFDSENRFMWPTEKLNFYAYSYGVPTTDDGWDSFADLYPTKDDLKSVFGEITIEYGTQKFTGFTPNEDISKQIDFVTATASGTGTDEEKANGVGLTFNHALSQIQIQALENDPEYIYNIRGVKIVNVISKDEFNMGNGYWLNSDPNV